MSEEAQAPQFPQYRPPNVIPIADKEQKHLWKMIKQRLKKPRTPRKMGRVKHKKPRFY